MFDREKLKAEFRELLNESVNKNKFDYLSKNLKKGKKVYLTNIGKSFDDSGIIPLIVVGVDPEQMIRFHIAGGVSRDFIYVVNDKDASNIYFKYNDAFEALKSHFK